MADHNPYNISSFHNKVVVTMNNMELNDLMVCAFRYALGRRSYITYTISDLLIKHKDKLFAQSKESILKDIKKAFDTNDYGMEMDKEVWIKLQQELTNDKS
ncbi:MAG: hypothetical protein RJA03_464 [Pseudomonadota bacterium]